MTALTINGPQTLCPHGLTDPWPDNIWDKYPEGVKVTFAPILGKQLLLTRPVKWNYALPQAVLCVKDTLESSISWLRSQLGAFGVTVSDPTKSAQVIKVAEFGGALHLLMVVQVNGVPPSSRVERIDSALMLGGLAVGSPWVAYLPSLLGWKDAALSM